MRSNKQSLFRLGNNNYIIVLHEANLCYNVKFYGLLVRYTYLLFTLTLYYACILKSSIVAL